MATKSTTPSSQSIDKALGETDLGTWLTDNKGILISLIVLIFLAVFGWGAYGQMTEKKNQELGKVIYQFKTTSFQSLIDKKTTPVEYLSSFKTLKTKVGDFEGMIPLLINSANELSIQDAKTEAIEVLKMGSDSFKEPLVKSIVSFHLAANYEDVGNNAKAIEVLEELNSSSKTYMEDKVYLDLGRLYLKTGNKEKAKTNLQHLVDNGQEEEFTKLAKIYLEDAK